MIRKYAEIFCWKNVSSFCSAKATHIFSAKNIRVLYIESIKTVNKMTLNELVKLTMLWTTGPRNTDILKRYMHNNLKWSRDFSAILDFSTTDLFLIPDSSVVLFISQLLRILSF